MPQPDLSKLSRKVLLIGWDAADWKIINPLLDAGKMPNLEKLVSGGVIGNLATLRPDLSPMLWTSIATGKRPFKHGILGFSEPTPAGDGVRPVTNLARKCRAIWNMLTLCGMRCHVMGWWPSHPVEPINGVMISNQFHSARKPHGEPWPIPPGAVHPQRIIRNLEKLRTHPQDLDPRLVQLFVPKLFEIDQEKDHRIETLAKTMAESITIRDAACAVLHHEPWHFGAVYFDAIDHFCHAFMRYHPPRMDWVPEEDYEIYKHVIEAAYQLHDIHLGMLMKQVPEDGYIMLISDHGFHSDHLRPRTVPNEPAGPAVQHRPYGIFVLHGPDVKTDERIYGASLLDICPTILSIYGLPMGEDMDGKPLVNAFSPSPDVLIIPSWEDATGGPDGSHSEETRLDPVASREALQQLVDLGYIDPIDDDRDKAVANAVRELEYNLGRSYMDASLHAEAIPIFEKLASTWPEQARFGVQLATCLQAVGRLAEAREVIEKAIAAASEDAVKAREELVEWRKSKGEKFDFSTLDEKEQRHLRTLRTRATIDRLSIDYLLGTIHQGEGHHEAALKLFREILKRDKTRTHVYVKIGDTLRALKQFAKAEAAYKQALAIDAELPDAQLGLCRTYLRQRKNLRAAESAMAAAGLRFHNPMAHYILGIALHRLNQLYPAIEALELAVAQNPNFPEAHIRLAYIYSKRLHQPGEAKKHKELAKAARERIRKLKTRDPGKSADKGEFARLAKATDQIGKTALAGEPAKAEDLPETVLVVTGLPRSGTSMMMQMLEAGGVPVLSDGVRTADESNPKGYLEYEKARALRKDKTWVPKAKGKAVKIVAQLLPALPPPDGFRYRVLFMERELEDVVRSQLLMLERQGKKPKGLSEGRLAGTFAGHLRAVKTWLARRKMPVLMLAHADVIDNPASAARTVNRFLGGRLDEKAMAAVVDPSLHRVKGTSEKRGPEQSGSE